MLVLCLLLSLISLSFQSEEASLLKMKFQNFIVKYNKTYSNTETARRYTIFKENLKKIEAQNKNSKHAVFGVNEFADWTQEEFRARRLAAKIPSQSLATRYVFVIKDALSCFVSSLKFLLYYYHNSFLIFLCVKVN
jgi:hypothetical protein